VRGEPESSVCARALAKTEPPAAIACLARLLPVVELNKEFTDFFDDPKQERLTFWPSMVFSVIAMVGWILGAITVAAFAGLTQSP
jgi:hypothetical protein